MAEADSPPDEGRKTIPVRRPRSRRGKTLKVHVYKLDKTLARMREQEEEDPIRDRMDAMAQFAALVSPVIGQTIANAPVFSDLLKQFPTIPLDTFYDTRHHEPNTTP